jgi:hypothetical protein
VIACRLTAVPETVGDAAILIDLPKGTGSFCEAKGVCPLVSAIETLRDATSRAAWVARGKIRAGRFTWPACVDRLAGFFVE